MININYILIISILTLDLILGLLVYFKNRRDKNSQAFFWVSFWAAVWIASNFLENEPILKSYAPLLLKIDFASAAFLAYSFFFFCINFPKNLNFSLLQKIALILPCSVFFILSFSPLIIKNISFSDSTVQFERGILYWFYALAIICYVVVGSLSLIFRFKALRGTERIQTFYIILGFTLSGIVAISINLILTQIIVISTEIYRIGIYGILFFIIFTTYALIKHHLMNIKVILTEILAGLVSLILLIDLLLSDSLPIILLKSGILVVFVYLGVSLIRSVLREIEMRERIKKAYEVEKRARAAVEELTEAKTQFIMATQHHLRTPLTSMIGYLDLLFGGTYGKFSPKIKTTLLKFQVSTRRLIRVVNALLDISQFQMGKKVVALQPGIKFEDLIKEVIEELQFEAENRGLYLKLEKGAKLPTIKADPEKLKVALFNIVDNAIKYTRKGGITVTLQKKGAKLQVLVKDTGIGIEPEQAKKLFKTAFERGAEAKKVHGFGRGIGVYVTGHIIKAHNGKIWAESEGRGKGSTFFIELPIG